MLSFDMLKKDRSCLGAVAAFSTTPLDSVFHISLDHLTFNLAWYKSTFIIYWGTSPKVPV